MSQWSNLLVELLSIVDEHSDQLVDKIRIRCVCKNWQSLSPKLPDLRKPQPPWLLLPYADGPQCGLYHPLENKVYEIDLPEAGEKVFVGSGHGWVVSVQLDGSINIVNPLSRIQFHLPRRYKFPDVTKYRKNKIGHEFQMKGERNPNHIYTADSMYVRNCMTEKIALSSSPASSNFRAVAIYGTNGKLAYCKIGDKKWTNMVEMDTGRDDLEFQDVTFRDGKLYALSNKGDLMICDDIVSCPKLRTYAPLPECLDFTYNVNLVSSSYGLMVVRRKTEIQQVPVSGIYYNDLDYGFTHKTQEFEVFLLDMTSLTWFCVQRLGSGVLFMGLGEQLCFQTHSDVGNQIYFSSHQLFHQVREIKDCFDNGIYHMVDKTFKPLGYECNPQIIWPSPIWVISNPY